MALRVNRFSLVYASLAVAGVQTLARRSGATRWASTLGALCLASSAGLWFYSGFVKHDMFSGLVLLIALRLDGCHGRRPRGSPHLGARSASAWVPRGR